MGRKKLMRKLIGSYKFFILTVVILGCLLGIQVAAARIIDDRSEPQEITVTSIEVIAGTQDFFDNSRVRLRGEYNGDSFTENDPKIVLSYIKNPGPMMGTRYASGRIILRPRN